MSLYCNDNQGDNVVLAQLDPVILDDPRVVNKLLDLEHLYIVSENYFATVQDEITPQMRKTCLSWLMEVTDNERCEDAVFPLAANIMDRFLAKHKTPKDKLQLLGCVSLMLASKLRQTRCLGSSLLSAYTAYTYSSLEILVWEMDVLTALKWNLASVIPNDYTDTIIYRLPDFQGIQHLAGKHAKTFQQLTVLDFEFSSWPPSLIAMSTIGAAIKGLPNIETVWPHVTNLHQLFYEMTNVEIETILNCIEYMEAFVDKCISRAQRVQAEEQLARKHDDDPPYDDQPGTPTDVTDVHF